MFRCNVETALYQHFFYEFYPRLILSGAHPAFHAVYVPEFVEMVFAFDGVRNVVLACAASHMDMIVESPWLHELSLTYYSRAVSDVNRALDGINSIGDRSCDALLTAIIFLYIRGVSWPEVGTARFLGVRKNQVHPTQADCCSFTRPGDQAQSPTHHTTSPEPSNC